MLIPLSPAQHATMTALAETIRQFQEKFNTYALAVIEGTPNVPNGSGPFHLTADGLVLDDPTPPA